MDIYLYLILQSTSDTPQPTSEIAKIKSTGAGASYKTLATSKFKLATRGGILQVNDFQ